MSQWTLLINQLVAHKKLRLRSSHVLFYSQLYFFLTLKLNSQVTLNVVIESVLAIRN